MSEKQASATAERGDWRWRGGRRKRPLPEAKPLWLLPAEVEAALRISPHERRALTRAGTLTGIYPKGRGNGKPVRYDPKELELYAAGQMVELKEYQRKMGRGRRR